MDDLTWISLKEPLWIIKKITSSKHASNHSVEMCTSVFPKMLTTLKKNEISYFREIQLIIISVGIRLMHNQIIKNP
jgi:hypothetical protein